MILSPSKLTGLAITSKTSLSYYPLAVIRFSDESNLREKGFVLMYISRTQSFTTEEALKSTSSTDAHMVSVLEKHRPLDAHV